MFALALDVPPLPLWTTPVLAYRQEAVARPDHPWRQVSVAMGYAAGSALTTRTCPPSKSDDWLADFQPRTGLGRRLLALRTAYVAGGGQLMSAAMLDDVIRDRRGSAEDA